MRYRDRKHAGIELAKALASFRGKEDVVVIGLPRGGVVVAAEVAKALALPLDIVVPRKLGAEGNEEYAIGAIAEDGEVAWNETERSAADPAYLKKIMEKERREAKRRLAVYRSGLLPLDLAGKTALLVDDGVATGLTMRAAIRSARAKGAGRIVVAVPHGAADSLKELEAEADEVIALQRPAWYGAVGEFYESFAQTDDETVINILKGLEK